MYSPSLVLLHVLSLFGLNLQLVRLCIMYVIYIPPIVAILLIYGTHFSLSFYNMLLGARMSTEEVAATPWSDGCQNGLQTCVSINK